MTRDEHSPRPLPRPVPRILSDGAPAPRRAPCETRPSPLDGLSADVVLAAALRRRRVRRDATREMLDLLLGRLGGSRD
ncbi:hypothetical protein ACQ5SO_14930 [Rhodovulum sp. DZ06]|uniref:hypothetical protein n=1 Tax=Rhodovulum sp. DZ06 TaxID=3425126 RepID=UPI003D336F4E